MFLFLLACHHNIGFEQKSNEPVEAWKDLLIEVTFIDGVDYQTLQNNRAILEDYLGWIGENGPRMNRLKGIRTKRRKREDRRITHYANAYNAWVLYEILESYPTDSVENITLDQFQIFENSYRLDGEYMTLHHIKEERILGTYQEPLLHMMLFDGSLSSPALQYWEADQLKHVLRRRFVKYLQSDQGARLEGENWLLSELFQREEDDFIYWSNKDDLCQYLSEYTRDELQTWLRQQEEQNCSLQFQSWDYRLNDRKLD